uniref:glucans biosynthesis glucosyltransferase MdoH n=1 Tax=Ningiella ruwaisensis TaxID=2364274 RepID=UPI00109F55B5|nr:glucans biosynthesis glucosyltransferase MdoH [Ningiella ruwaisensis]
MTKAKRQNRDSLNIRPSALRFRKYLYATCVFSTAIAGGWAMGDIFSESGITIMEAVLLFLFTLTFVWIAAAFYSASIGFILQLFKLDPLSLKRKPDIDFSTQLVSGKHAIIMPVYNEDTSRIMAGMEASIIEIAQSGNLEHFDFFMLSDTQDKQLIEAEHNAWQILVERIRNNATCSSANLYYRRREKNTNRKVGNVADFCKRWGAHYETMTVFDADSLMTSHSIISLVSHMQANPKTGLLQTVPIPVRSATFFGRFLQFAACLYCPTLANGQAFWQTNASNYWGHNAVIRISAFVESCGLPSLGGRPPFGGDILSHDFVEAALLARSGYDVYLLANLEGSYEELPSNIIDYASRDRRWVQGNMQHLGLLNIAGMRNLSRLHFFLGAFAYISSLVWCLLLFLSTIDGIVRATSDPVFFTQNYQLFPIWSVDKSATIFFMLGATAFMLIGPKFMSLIIALLYHAKPFGGRFKLTISMLIETVFAIIIAPLMMAFHAYFVLNVLCGSSIKWEAQGREGRRVPWKESFKRTYLLICIALLWAALTYIFTPILFWWLSPITFGFLISPALIHFSSSLSAGEFLRDLGIFLTPSEVSEPRALHNMRLAQYEQLKCNHDYTKIQSLPHENAQTPEDRIWCLPPEKWREMKEQDFKAKPTDEQGDAILIRR